MFETRQCLNTNLQIPVTKIGTGLHTHTIVLGIGNPLRGDDGVGPAVIHTLSNAHTMPSGVSLLDCGGDCLMSVLLTQSYTKAILVDAVDMDCTPGDWIRFTMEDAIINSINVDSWDNSHHPKLVDTIALAEALDIKLPELVIYGIQPLSVGWKQKLSGAVLRVIPEVCQAILNELTIDS